MGKRHFVPKSKREKAMPSQDEAEHPVDQKLTELSLDQLLADMESLQTPEGRRLSSHLCCRMADILDEAQFERQSLIDTVAACLILAKEKCRQIVERYNAHPARKRAAAMAASELESDSKPRRLM